MLLNLVRSVWEVKHPTACTCTKQRSVPFYLVRVIWEGPARSRTKGADQGAVKSRQTFLMIGGWIWLTFCSGLVIGGFFWRSGMLKNDPLAPAKARRNLGSLYFFCDTAVCGCIKCRNKQTSICSSRVYVCLWKVFRLVDFRGGPAPPEVVVLPKRGAISVKTADS